ncbi:MAG TPA: cell wall hydrolase [Bacillota bacterium]|nr:cell wall hydrolase [Bacillota bacterium]
MTDLEVLTRITWGEAESESLTGKMGVAASIVNQAQAENKNVLQVVQTPGQFEAFANNRFYQAPYGTQAPMIQEARQAATRILSGEDPISNKTHFCAFRKNPCRWHYSQTPPIQYIGSHMFVRAKAYNQGR